MSISSNFYKIIFENSTDGMLIIEDSKFIDCNYATVKMLGYKDKNELLNTHPSELSPEFQPDGRTSFEKAEENTKVVLEQGQRTFEWVHTRSNG
jgi:PAS domain S-box-containing protein